MDLIKEIEAWFESNCNGDWEHTFGCRIGTLDNPGWYVEIDLEDTDLEVCFFEEIDQSSRSDNDWILCKVENKTFKGFGGIYNLHEILSVFINWMGRNKT